MRASLSAISREMLIQVSDMNSPEVAGALASFAVSAKNELIDSGSAPPNYQRYVNGRLGAGEWEVVPPGPILYEFNLLTMELVNEVLKFCRERSPVGAGKMHPASEKTGPHYSGRWVALVGGVEATEEILQFNDTVTIVNDQPYHRKIETGHGGIRRDIVGEAQEYVNSRYGNLISAKKQYVFLRNGYILKGNFRRGKRENSRKSLQKDTKASAMMTYPALILEQRFE